MKRFSAFILWIGTALFSISLLLYAYLGLYNRFWADDWCYNADLKTLGFWGTIQGYLYITHYASNRFSLTIFTALLQWLGVFGVQMIALLVTGLWYGGLMLVMQGINRLFRLNIPLLVIALATGTMEYYSLYLAPNQFQILYWRAGVLPYSAPLIFSLFIFGLLLWQLNSEKMSKILPVWVAVLSFLAGGFSELACASLIAALVMLWGVIWFYGRRGTLQAQRTLGAVSAALIFATISMVVLILSPANEPRRLASYAEPTSLWMVPMLAVLYTFDFIQSSIRGLIVPYAAFSLIFLLIPFASYLQNGNALKSSSKNITIAMLAVAVCAILLIAASQTPNIYIEKGPPAPRGMIFARFILNLALAGIFWLAGNWLVLRLAPQWIPILTFSILLPLVYTLRPIGLTYAELPRFVERAQTWDERDRVIRSAKEQGILKIDVRAIDSKYMDHTLELKEKPTFWINSCAEAYYDMQEIRATLPP